MKKRDIKKQNVLIVDDEPESLLLVGKTLEKMCHVVTASSGKEALKLARKKEFALIILDVLMPHMDGFKVAKALKSDKKTKLIPIIFITAARQDSKYVFEGYNSGAVDYIRRPYEPQILQSKVEVFLGVHRQRNILEHEIEERKKAEEKFKATVILKDNLHSSIINDFQVPLKNITESLKEVLDAKEEPLHSDQRQKISEALHKGETLLDICQDLIEIGRLRSGTLKPKSRFLDALTTVIFSTANLEEIAEKKGVKLVSEVPEGVRLYADAKLFMKVIQNLVSNAIKFCRKGDIITLFIPPGEPTTLAVRDTGMGIEKKRQKHLFNYEEHTSTPGTLGEKGMGIGLPQCRDIMKAHGGSLVCESAHGEGSVFYAKLPHAHPVTLLVDDDPLMHALLKKILKPVDTDILEAENGKVAWKILSKIRPHLIILDIFMPEMNGFELLVKIRNDSRFEDTPVIVLTSDAKEETWKKAYQLKANDFLPKPFDSDELMPLVRKYI